MTERLKSTVNTSENKGGKVFPALCSVFGTVILLGVIAAFFPLTVPRLMGYNIYEVVSGSMEPEIPVGSVIYVKAAEPETVEAGDIIAFVQNGSVITHRVEEKEHLGPQNWLTNPATFSPKQEIKKEGLVRWLSG